MKASFYKFQLVFHSVNLLVYFKGYVHTLLCYPLQLRKPLSYGGLIDTSDGDPTPNGVRSNWDFTLGRPLICWWYPVPSTF